MTALPAQAAERGGPPGYAGIRAADDFPAAEDVLEALRLSGDIDGQRRHLWRLYDGLTRSSGPAALPAFMTWYSAAEAFGDSSAVARRTVARAFGLPPPGVELAPPGALPPLITRVHYNGEAYRHIRDHGLNRRSVLRALSHTHGASSSAPAVPVFPRAAVVLKTVWWPVPRDGLAAMPIWDADRNPANADGNDYPTWDRLVSVCGSDAPVASGQPADVEFLGRLTQGVRCVPLERFYHVILDPRSAAVVMQDPLARRLAAMVFGRKLRAGDALALVAMHVATRELTDWVWGTFWWHDGAAEGGYAALRPPQQLAPWSRYRMDVAFDAVLPRGADGGPKVAFNPWLEARFADQGEGGGVVSNCLSCHRRAAFRPSEPLRVTRGATGVENAPNAVRRVATSALWTIPLQAR
jgi:hypothetical protein